MRFSLYSLVVFVMLAALTINFVSLYSRSLESLVTASKIKAETEKLALQVPDKDRAKAQHRELTESIDALTESSTLLHEHFVKHINAEYKIVPKPDSFSVLERPEFRKNHQRGFLKTFLLYSPETQKLAIHVTFDKKSNIVREGSGRFKSTDYCRIPIPQGKSKLDVSFAPGEQEGERQVRWFLKILLDDKEVVSREFIEGKSKSRLQWSNFPYDPQRDYTMIDKPPKLVWFQPSSSKTKVQLSVVREDSDE